MKLGQTVACLHELQMSGSLVWYILNDNRWYFDVPYRAERIDVY